MTIFTYKCTASIWCPAACGTCEVRRWQGWSDAKGNSAELNAARGVVAVNAQMDSVTRAIEDVIQALEVQLAETFLGHRHLEVLKAQKVKVVMRARVLEADGTALCAKTLWERQIHIGVTR